VERIKTSTLFLFVVRMAKPACWVELRYGWGLKGIPIARSGNPKLLRHCKQILLAEAEQKTEMSGRVDSVLGSIEKQELIKLRSVLDLLVKNGTEGEDDS